MTIDFIKTEIEHLNEQRIQMISNMSKLEGAIEAFNYMLNKAQELAAAGDAAGAAAIGEAVAGAAEQADDALEAEGISGIAF